MNFEDTLGTILTGVFGNEIYPIVHPDPDGKKKSVSDLYAIYSIIGGTSFNKLNGSTGLSRPRIQVSIYATDYSDMKIKQRALEAAMDAANLLASQCVDNQVDYVTVPGALPNVSVSVPTEDYELNTKRYFSHTDFYCWSKG
jgi:hypothetical protein